MKQVLIPYQISEECTLLEALYYMAFSVYPLSNITTNGKDIRRDSEYNEAIKIDPDPLPSDQLPVFILDNKKCEIFNLPTNPHIEYFKKFNDVIDRDLDPFERGFKEIINSMEKINKEEFEKLKAEQLEAMQTAKFYIEKVNKWDSAIEEALEAPKLKLLLALKEGKIKAFGRRLLGKELEEGILEFPDFMEIDLKFWQYKSINWNDSIINSQEVHYIHILLNLEDLFKAFPEPEPEIVSIKSINGTLLLDVNKSDNEDFKKNYVPRGRPSNNCIELHVEIAKYIKKYGILPKQMALISHLNDWYQKEFGKRISETAIKTYLKPYYQSEELKKS